MNDAETEFLALVALGMFALAGDGRIWRYKEWTKGSRSGSEPALIKLATPRLADVSSSGKSRGRRTSYRRVMFVAKGRRWSVHAHRVVWMLTSGEPIPKGLEINHRNGDGLDNFPGNLEVVTASANVTHAIRVLGVKRKARSGSENPASKLTEGQAAQIRRLAAMKTMPQWKIGEIFGVDQQTVSNILNRKTWRHVLTG